MASTSDSQSHSNGRVPELDEALKRLSAPVTPAEMHAAMVTFLRELGVPDDIVEIEVLEFRRELTNETDRGVALYAAAHLDDRLVRLLRSCLVENEAVSDPLFKGMGALATFSARIDMAYLLGLLPSSVRRELHLVRKIRNEFGHEAKPIRFVDAAIAQRCRGLTRATLAEEPRLRFIQGVMGLAGIIDGAIRRLADGRCARCVEATEVAPQNSETVRQALRLIAGHLGTTRD